ncbi:replicase [Shahe hepe-like virus 1]|uniref:replicase n=1 Tax=Shahe hepe-like virus 1 TaxID=1923415 RepID=UPI00090A3D9E|nr:replicase [Shahe hepe-like virus 1]APG77710.1 replicase [Shahe hepe-like virus 1]
MFSRQSPAAILQRHAVIGETTETSTENRNTNSSIALSSYPTYKVEPNVSDFWKNLYDNRMADAIELPFNATNTELQNINEMLAPIVVTVNTKWQRVNTHFYEAALLFLAENFLNDKVAVAKNNGQKIIEIGANYRKIATSPGHFCQTSSGREEARIRAAMSEATFPPQQIARLQNYLAQQHCTKGAEKCSEPCDLLIANNVTYDVTHEQLEKIFLNHGATEGYFAMLIPDELLIGISSTNTRWQYTLDFRKDQTHFGFLDGSWKYVHKTSTWIEWATKDVYEGFYLNLLFERYKKFGNMYIYRVAATPKTAKLSHNHFLNAPNGFTEIRDFLPAIPALALKLQAKWPIRSLRVAASELEKVRIAAKIHYIPTEIVNKIVAFCWNRKDSEIDRHPAGAMFISAASRIVIGEYSVQKGVMFNDRDFDPIVMNIFLRALIQRYKSTKETAYFINNISKLMSKNTTWGATLTNIADMFLGGITGVFSKDLTDIYGVSKETLAVYALLLGIDPGIDEYTSQADSTHLHQMPVPESKDYVVDPIDDGFCLSDCLKPYLGMDKDSVTPLKHMGPNLTETAFENVINTMGYTIQSSPGLIPLDISIDNGHATISTDTSKICLHEIMYKPYIPFDGLIYNGKWKFYDASMAYYKRKEGNLNNQKTEFLLSLFEIAAHKPTKKDLFWRRLGYFNNSRQKALMAKAKDNDRILNAAAAPFNDRRTWVDMPHHDVEHNIVHTEDVSNFTQPLVPKTHKSLDGLNLFCHKCTNQITFRDIIISDLGLDLPNANLSMAIATELRNLRTSTNWARVNKESGKPVARKIAVKIQKFTEQLREGTCGSLILELAAFWTILRVPCNAPDEVFAILDDTKNAQAFMKLRKIKPISLNINSIAFPLTGMATTTVFGPTIAKITIDYEVNRFYSERMGLEHCTVPSWTNKHCSMTRRKMVDPSAPMLDDIGEVQSSTFERFTTDTFTSAPRAVLSQMEITITPSEALNNLPIGCTIPITKGVIYRATGRTDAVEIDKWQTFAGKEVVIKDASVEQALQLTSKFEKVYLDSKRITSTYQGNGALFDLPADQNFGLPIYATFFHPEHSLIPLTQAVAVYRSDIPNIKGKLPPGSVQIVDVKEDCPCHANIPFHGIITSVNAGTVYGPQFVVPELAFTPVVLDYSKCSKSEISNLIRELKNTKGTFAELHKESAEAIADLKPKEMVTVHGLLGTYGSGKTTMAAKYLRNKIDFVVTPTKNLADEYKSLGFKAYTWAIGLKQKKDSNILIDEAWCFDPRVLWAYASLHNKVFVIGDDDQMKGGGKTLKTSVPDLRELIPKGTLLKRWITMSTPLDAVAALNTNYNMKVTSLSRVLNSKVVKTIKGKLPKACSIKCEEEHQHFFGACFDEKHANNIKWPTVATIQGLRKDEFNLFLSSNCAALIQNVHGQALVAMSRHRKTLNIWVDNIAHVNKLFFPILNDGHKCKIGARDRFHTIMGATDVLSHSFKISEPKTKQVVDFKFENDAFKKSKRQELEEKMTMIIEGSEGKLPEAFGRTNEIRKENFSKQMLNAGEVHHDIAVPLAYAATVSNYGPALMDYTLENIIDVEALEEETEPDHADKYGLSTATAGMVGPVALAFKENFGSTFPIESEIKRFEVLQMRQPKSKRSANIKGGVDLLPDQSKSTLVPLSETHGLNQRNISNHRLHTITERYLSNGRNVVEDAEAEAHRLWTGFEKFVDVNKFREITPEEVNNARAQALTRVRLKRVQHNLNPFGTDYESTEKISGFNKQQLKAKAAEGSELPLKLSGDEFHLKGGQPVSAQAKTINEIVSPYVYLLCQQVENACKPGVGLGYGHSRKRFRRRITKRLDAVRKGSNSKNHFPFSTFVNVDISEQDTTKTEGTRIFNKRLFAAIGAPKDAIAIMEEANVNWVCDMSDMSANVENQYQSGRADTIDSNTFDSMGEIGSSIKFDEDVDLAYFCGDDSCVLAAGIEFPDPPKYLKIQHTEVGSFLNYLITKEDVYLDIPRMVAKVLSREYDDASRIEELKTAVSDIMHLHDHVTDRHNNQVICSAFYKMPLGDVVLMYEYLIAYASPHFDTIPARAKKGQGEVFTSNVQTFSFKGAKDRFV